MNSIAIDDTSLELLSIPSGEFLMGSTNQFFSETPSHRVEIPCPLLIGKFPITQAQWFAVMGSSPSSSSISVDHPVDSVSWDDANAFCLKLSRLCLRTVRLPSESEWEYVCRAGSKHDFFFGEWGPYLDDSQIPWEIQNALTDYAWFELNSNEGTRPVGLKLPNPWGLHDMIGNVWEWCEDVWHGDYAGAPTNGRARSEGADRQTRRCLRGGAWDMNAFRCRSAYRSYDHKQMATSRFGFRVVVAVE